MSRRFWRDFELGFAQGTVVGGVLGMIVLTVANNAAAVAFVIPTVLGSLVWSRYDWRLKQ